MGTSNLNFRCIYDKNSSILVTVLHGFVFAVLIVTAGINVAFATLPVSVVNLSLGDNATFSCSPEGTLRQLTWSKTEPEATAPNSEFILRYLAGFSASYGSGVDHTHYEFDEASNAMTVVKVTLDDDGRYWCEAGTAEFLDAVNSTLASINVPPVASTTTITYSGKPYMNGDTIKVDTGAQMFTCTTTSVKPAATFVWTPDPLSETTTSVENTADSRLFDSSSEVSIQIMKPLSPSELKCATSNTDDGSSRVEVTVKLELKEPIGLSTPAKIGIGVGCACGCVIAAGCGIAIYKYNKTTEVTPEGQSKEGQSKKGQSKKGKKKDADGKTPENV